MIDIREVGARAEYHRAAMAAEMKRRCLARSGAGRRFSLSRRCICALARFMIAAGERLERRYGRAASLPGELAY